LPAHPTSAVAADKNRLWHVVELATTLEELAEWNRLDDFDYQAGNGDPAAERDERRSRRTW